MKRINAPKTILENMVNPDNIGLGGFRGYLLAFSLTLPFLPEGEGII